MFIANKGRPSSWYTHWFDLGPPKRSILVWSLPQVDPTAPPTFHCVVNKARLRYRNGLLRKSDFISTTLLVVWCEGPGQLQDGEAITITAAAKNPGWTSTRAGIYHICSVTQRLTASPGRRAARGLQSGVQYSYSRLYYRRLRQRRDLLPLLHRWN